MSWDLSQAKDALMGVSRLMSYPDREWRAGLDDAADHIASLPEGRARDLLSAFVRGAREADAGEFEQRYVRVFDMGKGTNLYLTGRGRADAGQQRMDMVGYSVFYRERGVEPDHETPDYLPAVLELAATSDDAQAAKILRWAHDDLEALRVSLERAGVDDYEGLVRAVQAVAALCEQEVAA